MGSGRPRCQPPGVSGSRQGRGGLVVLLLVVGTLLLVRAPSAANDATQFVGLLLGGLGVGAAVMLIRDSVLRP